jgi:hypothetical protein
MKETSLADAVIGLLMINAMFLYNIQCYLANFQRDLNRKNGVE